MATRHRALPARDRDQALGTASNWCPQVGENSYFGNRTRAEALLEIPCLRDENGLTGRGVNVVIVDQGLNAQRLGTNYAGGWTVGGVPPGMTKPAHDHPHGGHGMMVAANIRAVTPEVRFFDLPMIPPRILDIPKFFGDTANAAFETMLDDIEDFSRTSEWPGHWVLVNAWAIYERKSERNGEYTNNPNHPFNRLMDRAVDAGHDVIFGAGNCGEFCPSSRCGLGDRGPGQSIHGANSHPKVLTVGAVRSDRIWLGYSSQGPGQSRLERRKPDLCAPSEFVEDNDAHTVNGGTSAACAMAAGVIAALRGRWNATSVPPLAMKAVLNRTAAKAGNGWSERTGNGILNARDAFEALSARRPSARIVSMPVVRTPPKAPRRKAS